MCYSFGGHISLCRPEFSPKPGRHKRRRDKVRVSSISSSEGLRDGLWIVLSSTFFISQRGQGKGTREEKNTGQSHLVNVWTLACNDAVSTNVIRAI